jgi:hypothetical protein
MLDRRSGMRRRGGDFTRSDDHKPLRGRTVGRLTCGSFVVDESVGSPMVKND